MKVEFLNSKEITEQEFLEEKAISENEFGTETDPEQMDIKSVTFKTILEKIPYNLITIKVDSKVVGSVFAIICNEKMMNDFVSKKINERQLYNESLKSINYDNFNCIYLAGMSVLPKYRRKGIASKATLELIKNLAKLKNNKVTVFSWGYTKVGQNIVMKVAKTLNLPYKYRIRATE